MPGRNDPCPCGSGKKYKKCCWQKDQEKDSASPTSTDPIQSGPQPSRPRNPLRPPPPRVEPPPPQSPPRPPPDPRQAAFNRFWEDFESRDYEGQIAAYLSVLDNDELMEPDLTFEMLVPIIGGAMERGEWERFRGLIESMRQRRPDVYEEGAVSYLSWITSAALVAGQLEAVRPQVLELGRRASEQIDIFNRTFDQLAFHDYLDTLVEMLRLGWPGVKTSSNVVPWGVSGFADRGARYEIFQYLEQTADPQGDCEALLERLRFFVEDPDPKYVGQMVDTLVGRNVRSWSLEDFQIRPPRKRRRSRDKENAKEEKSDSGFDNLVQLSLEFLGYLHHKEGVPYPKGEMARNEVVNYFVRRHEGDLNPRGNMYEEMVPRKKSSPAPKPEHPLCPERVTLDIHISGMVNFFNAMHFQAGAIFEVMPGWLRFLQTRGLIDADRRRRTVEQLMPLQADLLRLWGGSREYADLHRAMQAWPDNAAMEPKEA